MTIRYEGREVFHETTVGAKGALLDALMGGPRTVNLRLVPDREDPLNDTVVVSASYGSYEVKGSDKNANSTCLRNHIRWSCY